MKEAEVELKSPEQLQHEMKCPQCGNPVSCETMFKCNKCKTQIIFFVKKE